MKIELIRQRFDETREYKYQPLDVCCGNIAENPCIVFSDSVEIDDNNLDDYLDYECTFPAFALVHTESDYDVDWDTYYKISHCPFCGEPIEITVVGEEDVEEYYKNLKAKRDELWKKHNRTDSKKRSQELYEQVRKLDDQINWLYHLTEYKDVKSILES